MPAASNRWMTGSAVSRLLNVATSTGFMPHYNPFLRAGKLFELSKESAGHLGWCRRVAVDAGLAIEQFVRQLLEKRRGLPQHGIPEFRARTDMAERERLHRAGD